MFGRNPKDSDAGTAPRPQRKRFSLSLRAALILVTLFTVCVTAFAVHIPWQHTAERNVEDISRQLNNEIMHSVRREVGGLFGRAEAVQQSLHDIFSKRVVEIFDKKRTDQLYFSILHCR